ncbi:hypothetical protein H9W95_17615 [Flavobacterium lindanitolerans]|nr:hypothetical protein [Flavobacterium lindanitolerans]
MKRITTIATALLLATLFPVNKPKTPIPTENSQKTVEKPQEIAVNLQPTPGQPEKDNR